MTRNDEKCKWCGSYDPRVWEEHTKSFRHRFALAVTAFFWMT